MFFVVLLLFSTARLVAGYEISICDSIDKKGGCLGKSDVFHFTGDKMTLKVLVHNKEMLNTTKLLYIFQMLLLWVMNI